MLKTAFTFLCVSRTGLTFSQLLPEDRTQYDKMRPPKKDGAPTIVYFHVTVMGLDSIDETSMVCFWTLFLGRLCAVLMAPQFDILISLNNEFFSKQGLKKNLTSKSNCGATKNVIFPHSSLTKHT